MRLLRKIVRELGRREWFATLGMRLVPFDLSLQRRSGGRLSLSTLLGLPELVLTATGARSGRPRTTPLLYVPHADGYLVVGSNWGKPTHPDWTANLLAHPEAQVEVARNRIAVRARQVTGEERARLWRERITTTWPAYDDYARRAGTREIRVFLLEPVRG